jgi:hypothetical protein
VTQLFLAPVVPMAIGFVLCVLLTRLCVKRYGGHSLHDRGEPAEIPDTAGLPDQALNVRAR